MKALFAVCVYLYCCHVGREDIAVYIALSAAIISTFHDVMVRRFITRLEEDELGKFDRVV